MRIKTTTTGPKGEIKGYTLWLTSQDTSTWATRPGHAWPGSQLRGKRVVVQVDSNGLSDMAVNGKSLDVDGNELEAIVSDKLPKQYRHLWPVWGKAGKIGEGATVVRAEMNVMESHR
jgi:hypothetical protein